MKVRHICDKIDIDNKIKFRYYDINKNEKYVKVNNQYPCSLYTEEIGKEIELVIEDTHNLDLKIKLNYDGEKYSYLIIKKDDIKLARITLVCCGFNTNYGSKWYVKNYSGNISLE